MASSNTNNNENMSQAITQTQVIKQQIQEKLRSLVLLLRSSKNNEIMSIEVWENNLDKELHSLKEDMHNQIQEIHEIVLSCKPESSGSKSYEADKEAYRNLLVFVTDIIEQMRDLIITIFDRQRLFIHDIWQAFMNKEECDSIRDALNKDLDRNFNRWEQLLGKMKEKIDTMKD
ncbi:unnamed protein product [Rotaria socialis]|uniref:Uncharacterized protein n=1 Tax=Rotaria socialis TaxID=392032 RepID=A0A818GKX5_9BILA|nr:unnamed protein product [Rotaria socialis]CAF3378610.1 unnamed protein product [Rotaria socialis]CAF3493570.1 unnamed protein product [Rotaria socialis]CAF4499405.1 unnamed protein product [Rotaria socialis]CAF4554392.1 unnamed protein product [Rotaria socialis]